VTKALPGPALLDGVTVVPLARRAGGLVLTVSSPRHSLAHTVHPSPRDVTLRHAASGSRLRIDLPGVHVHGDVDQAAALHIGGLPVPARLVADGTTGTARVESWFSALPGTHSLQLALGGEKPVRLGLDLHVAGDGRVTVRRHTAAKKKAARAPSHPSLRAAVRRVPGLAPALRRLRPVVRRLRARASRQ
jgi:hypothetical protein